MTPVAPHIEAFLRENLSRHRGASQHTCDSYAYSFQLLFEFAATRLRAKPSSLSLEQLDSELVSAFLEYLEDTRRNAPETRNVRLAAIKSFFHFLEHRQPTALEQIRRVLAIPFKKTSSRLVPYLIREEVQALLDAPDPATREGIRDRAMLHLGFAAGLRVSELVSVPLTALEWHPTPSVRIRGKGRKERLCPLWPETASALRRIIRVEGSLVEAEDLISEERVWPIIFPFEVAVLLDRAYVINLELVRTKEGWQIASCGFAYPPGTEI
jgi:site-specific recombinase XerD